MIDYMYLSKFNYLKSSFPRREIATKLARMFFLFLFFVFLKKERKKERKKDMYELNWVGTSGVPKLF